MANYTVGEVRRTIERYDDSTPVFIANRIKGRADLSLSIAIPFQVQS